MKTCELCKLEKKTSEFVKETSRRRHLKGIAVCRLCMDNERANKRNHMSLEDRVYENIERKYGLSREEWNAKFALQNGKCAICLQEEVVINRITGEVQRLCVDHNKATGIVRGLLCYKCNVAIGLFLENKSSILNAIEYLNFYDESR